MPINVGHFHREDYTKFVNFSKAVLWMTKELSVQTYVITKVKNNHIPVMIFIDQRKKEIWTFKSADVIKFGREKIAGQEAQWYFPIKLAEIKKYE